MGRPVVFLQERCSGLYNRLRKSRWAIKGLARAREVYETSGLEITQREIEIGAMRREPHRAFDNRIQTVASRTYRSGRIDPSNTADDR